MKKIKFQVLPCVGPDLPKETGNVVDLLKAIPYFLKSRIPTLSVLNDLLRSGVYDAGMSGGAKWEPFVLNDIEYVEVRAELETLGLEWVEPPGGVRTRSDWQIWEMEIDHGVPADEHRRLNDLCEETERKLNIENNNGHDDQLAHLHIKYIELSNKLAAFVEKYLHRR